MVAPQKKFSLIDELLAGQQRLQTPVARFAEAHSAGQQNALQQNGDAARISALSV
jgi:hypothetical protein